MWGFHIFQQCLLRFTRQLLKVSREAGLFVVLLKTVLGLCISVREIFSDTIAFRDINKNAKRAVVQISTVVLPADHAGCQGVLSNMIFLNIYLKTLFGVLNFGNKLAMRFFFFSKAFKI